MDINKYMSKLSLEECQDVSSVVKILGKRGLDVFALNEPINCRDGRLVSLCAIPKETKYEDSLRGFMFGAAEIDLLARKTGGKIAFREGAAKALKEDWKDGESFYCKLNETTYVVAFPTENQGFVEDPLYLSYEFGNNL